ncbi:MAG TPA: phage terminase large subunit, partial [Alphaproteobacteria bacterium]|nr:phage terminase large subunit [Alphaproteobacteria bacterium]
MTVSFPEFVLLWQRWQNETTPALHRRFARWFEACLQSGDRRLLLLAFRNSGKSTLLGLLAAWLLTRDPDHRILVLAAEHALATKLSRFARRVVERHPLCTPLRGRGDAASWRDESFTVIRRGVWRDPSVLARGIGGNITGAHADTVICDDVEVPNTTGTPARRHWLRERLMEVEHILAPEGLQVFAGTPHTYYSIYAERPRPDAGETEAFLQGFRRCVVPVVGRSGKSAWPERFPPAAVEAMRRRVGPNAFASQMLLQPRRPEQSRLDPELLLPYGDGVTLSEHNRRHVLRIGERQMESVSVWWDPAYGREKGGDSSVVAVVFVDGEGGYWLHQIAYLSVDVSLSADPASQQCAQVAAIMAELHLPSITVECNGIGGFLPGLLRREFARLGVGASVVSASSRQAKAQRILAALDAPLAAGVLHAHESVFRTALIEEMREWHPAGRCR